MDKLVGMVASLRSTWKEHGVFIHMAGALRRRVSRSVFVLIGSRPKAKRWPYDRPYAYCCRMETLAGEQVPRAALRFMQFVPDAADIMRSLDVLVHTCSEEPFGRVAIEAMAAGRPAVGPSTGGIGETVVDGQTGILVEPRDVVGFADATERLVLNDELRRDMGDAGRARIEERYLVKHQIERVARLYASILSEARWQ